MPVQIFETEEVSYGCAPFKKARLAYNATACCLNMLVPNSSRGAMELCRDGPWSVQTEGHKCRINDIVTVSFPCEDQASLFARCIEEHVPAPCTPPTSAENKVAVSTERFSNTRRRRSRTNDENVDGFVDDLVKAKCVSTSAPQKESSVGEAALSGNGTSPLSINTEGEGCTVLKRGLKRLSSQRMPTSEFMAARRRERISSECQKQVRFTEPDPTCKTNVVQDRTSKFGPSVADEIGLQRAEEDPRAQALADFIKRATPSSQMPSAQPPSAPPIISAEGGSAAPKREFKRLSSQRMPTSEFMTTRRRARASSECQKQPREFEIDTRTIFSQDRPCDFGPSVADEIGVHHLENEDAHAQALAKFIKRAAQSSHKPTLHVSECSP